MKLLITGGAGFIGANFVYYMQENHPDYEISGGTAITVKLAPRAFYWLRKK